MIILEDNPIGSIIANDLVRLRVDVPELELASGDIGQVISTWCYPNTAYEVEFPASIDVCVRRVLLLRHQIAPQ